MERDKIKDYLLIKDYILFLNIPFLNYFYP